MLQLRKLSNPRRSSNEAPSGSGQAIPMTLLNEPSQANTLAAPPNSNIIVSTTQKTEMLNNNNNITTTVFDLDNNNNTNTAVAAVLNAAELNMEWINKPSVQKVVRLCAFASFLSICANTPETFKRNVWLMYGSYAVDLVVTLVFTVEMLAKIKIRGLFQGERAYIFDRWCQFDGCMVIFHIISVVLQSLTLFVRNEGYWSLLRCPRPLILIRVIRSLLKFRLPKNRINSILQRSSSQIYNVTLFFLFFMALYGILGVQFFGKLLSHCVKNSTNISKPSVIELMIPDTYCSPLGPDYGYQCPEGMKCEPIDLDRQARGFNGFDELITSIFTVYEAASQEGWVFLMYRATDSLPSWRAFFYFFSMIFFLAWLVKNVFIAVIIETFAEIRVQFQQMWGARVQDASIVQKHILERTEHGLKLVTVDENKFRGVAPEVLQRVARSSLFNMAMLLLVLANAIITATMRHTHKEVVDRRTEKYYYYIEIVFTILFDLEALFKILCLGFKSYLKRSIYKFEFIIAVCTTLRLIPQLYRTELTYFQVLRIVRLIKSSPMLEDFVNKIFGPGKKLGSLIIFTMCLLVITSCVSMQLFCFLGSPEYKKFDTFDQAFMTQFALMTSEGWTETMYDTMHATSENENFGFYQYFIPIYFIFSHMFCSLAFMTMFQILTQKGWLDIMHSTMRQSNNFYPLVAVYFISYHLFVTLIVLSLFVAVILDNLELEEDVKKIKQLKMREQSAETQETLPWRLRIFEKFPNQPQMVSLKRVPNEFNIPKIRESFMRQFLDDEYNLIEDDKALSSSTGGGATSGSNGGAAGDGNNANDSVSQVDSNERQNGGAAKNRNSMRTKTKLSTAVQNLESISENPTQSNSNANNVVSLTNPNRVVLNLEEVDNANLFRRRVRKGSFTIANNPAAGNVQAAQLRIINNIRMQRACRYSIKKAAINNMIDFSNGQRLFSGEGILMTTETMGKGGGALSIAGGISSSRNRTNQTSAAGNMGIRPGMNSISVGGLMKGSLANPTALMMGAAQGGTTASDIDFKLFQYKRQQAEMKRNQLEDDLKENHPYFDKPLFTIGRESNFRKFCQMVVEARYERKPVQGEVTASTLTKDKYKQFYKFLGLVTYLDWLMIAMTIQSCIGMMFETPGMRMVENAPLKVVEYLFVISMSIEMMLKVCAYGLFFTPKAVVKDFGGILDLFIFSVSVIVLYLSPKEIVANSGAQLIMLLRCLRPLRIFTLVPHMRKVIYELCRGFKEILLVSILLVVLIFIFANYGIQMYGGRLARCNDDTIKVKENCTGMYKRELFVTKLKFPKDSNKRPSIWVSRVWANPYNFNFDNIGSSMLTLFEVLSLEGWLEVRDVIIERIGTRHAIFVHVFVFIGALIGLTLFVGVVITNYSENKGTALLTVDQRRWLDLKGRIKLAQPLHIPPRPENSRIRAIIFDITQHKNFKRLSAFLVLLNCLLLSVPWKVTEAHTKPLATLAAIFTFLFLIEAGMKACALGPFGYWQSRRNRFDLFVTILGLVWIILHFVSFGKKDIQQASNSFGFVVIVLRFFTIAGKHATLKMLMLTIIVSFFKSFFIIVGMFLLMLVYAFAGVILFGCVKFGHDLGRHANFKSAPNAIVLLMRIVTGEEWNKIMHDCMIAPPACTRANNYWESDCGNFTAAILYFCSFYVIITYIVLNLLVAIIMENFSLFYSNEEDALLSYSDIRNFQVVWNIVDTNRKGIIPCKRVKFLLRLLRGRLEVDLEKDRVLFKHMCYEIERLNNGGDVTFHDVLNMLSYRSVDIRKSLKLEELLAREELEYQIEEEVAKITIRNWLDKCLRRMREKGGLSGKLGVGTTSKTGALNKQNDIAIFKEQMGARQLLPRLPSPPPQQQQQQSNNSQFNTFFPSMSSANLPGTAAAQSSSTNNNAAATGAVSRSPGDSSEMSRKSGMKGTEKKASYGSSENIREDQTRPSVTELSNQKTSNMKLKKKNTMDRQSQVMSEEKIKKRNMFIMESESMSKDVKMWWKSTLNDIDF